MWIARHLNKLFREAVSVRSLEELKARLDRALRILIYCKTFLSMARRVKLDDLAPPTKSIIWFSLNILRGFIHFGEWRCKNITTFLIKSTLWWVKVKGRTKISLRKSKYLTVSVAYPCCYVSFLQWCQWWVSRKCTLYNLVRRSGIISFMHHLLRRFNITSSLQYISTSYQNRFI